MVSVSNQKGRKASHNKCSAEPHSHHFHVQAKSQKVRENIFVRIIKNVLDTEKSRIKFLSSYIYIK